MVPNAINLYGFKYTETRRTISQVERDLAVNVGSLALECGWCAAMRYGLGFKLIFNAGGGYSRLVHLARALRVYLDISSRKGAALRNSGKGGRNCFALNRSSVLECFMRMALQLLQAGFGLVLLAWLPATVAAESALPHMQKDSEKAQPWPGGVIPYDISRLSPVQQTIALRAMRRWTDTGAKIKFVSRTTEAEYVSFTGKTDAGNNTSHVGFKKGVRADINITAFWWRQEEWMPAHELGHVLGFFHEHERWDRDRYVTVHYENIKPGRAADYDWIPKTNWIVSRLPYDYRSVMHYRVCWASRCEDECKDGVGGSPCAVIEPIDKKYDGVIGQWTDNGISALDAERARLAYGTRASPVAPAVPK
jgi:hypothetical protein